MADEKQKKDAKKAAPKKAARKKREKSREKSRPKKRRRKKPRKRRKKAKRPRKSSGEKRRRRKEAPAPKPAPIVVRASSRYVRIPPRKARLVANQVRGLHIERARALLEFSPRGAAQDIRKLIESAASNAENNHDLIADEMKVVEITVDEGPTLRRFRPRALGRATPINKRTSHIAVALSPEGEGFLNGTEDPPRRLPGRLHPGLEVELVRREGLRGRPPGGPPDPRPHREETRPRGALRNHDRAPRRGLGRHPHRPPGNRDRQVGQRSRRPPQGAPQADREAGESEHPRGEAPRARRKTGRPVDRRAAPEPGRVQAGDETGADLGDALRRQRGQGPGLGSPRRRRDGADRRLFRRPRPAPHAAGEHRLRLLRGPHHRRPDRRQMLDQQGRGDARGLPLRPGPRRRRAAAAPARARARPDRGRGGGGR